MAKNALIQARIERHLKDDVDFILKQLGLSASEVINALYAQIKLHNGIPFELKIPNQETIAAMQGVLNNENLIEIDDIGEFFEEIEAEARQEIQDQNISNVQSGRQTPGQAKKGTG